MVARPMLVWIFGSKLIHRWFFPVQMSQSHSVDTQKLMVSFKVPWIGLWSIDILGYIHNSQTNSCSIPSDFFNFWKKSDAPKTKNILGYSRVILGFFSVSRILGVLIFRVFFSKKTAETTSNPSISFSSCGLGVCLQNNGALIITVPQMNLNCMLPCMPVATAEPSRLAAG